MGLVDFGGELKLFGRMSKDPEPEEIKTGMEVYVRPVTYEDGQVFFEIFKA